MTDCGNALVDCATCDSDVDGIILPALEKSGLSLKDITYLILSHSHRDHAGGSKRILHYNPDIDILRGVRRISLPGVSLRELKGHTLDCIGVFVEDCDTLISADALQGDGIGKYRTILADEEEYLKTIDGLQADEKIENILFSHAYEPWYSDGVFGRENVKGCLEYCAQTAKAGR